MKLKTVVVAGGAAALGYLLGSRAGRAKFEQIKARAGELAHDPRLQSGVSNIAGGVRKNAERLPDPVAGIVRTAAEKVESVTKLTDVGAQTQTVSEQAPTAETSSEESSSTGDSSES